MWFINEDPSYDDDYEAYRCGRCGASLYEDDGPGWAWDGDRIEPFGWCPECGWSFTACPDIEDAYERSGEANNDR